jgi:hypothetical protein
MKISITAFRRVELVHELGNPLSQFRLRRVCNCLQFSPGLIWRDALLRTGGWQEYVGVQASTRDEEYRWWQPLPESDEKSLVCGGLNGDNFSRDICLNVSLRFAIEGKGCPEELISEHLSFCVTDIAFFA